MSETTTTAETEAPRRGRPPKSTTTSDQPDKTVVWCTDDEIRKFNRCVTRDFVKLGDDGKLDEKLAKRFFYRVVSSHPYVPAGVPNNSTEHLVKFNVQKFYRDRKAKQKISPDSDETIDVPAPVAGWGQNTKTGNLDKIPGPEAHDASFLMDAREFLTKFRRDSVENEE